MFSEIAMLTIEMREKRDIQGNADFQEFVSGNRDTMPWGYDYHFSLGAQGSLAFIRDPTDAKWHTLYWYFCSYENKLLNEEKNHIYSL